MGAELPGELDRGLKEWGERGRRRFVFAMRCSNEDTDERENAAG
jgi:hypothetical protein